jgi:hypothetical protein
MLKRIAFVLLGMFPCGCVDIPKFEPPPSMVWAVVPLDGSESAPNSAILLNKHSGETWITSSHTGTWQPIQR